MKKNSYCICFVFGVYRKKLIRSKSQIAMENESVEFGRNLVLSCFYYEIKKKYQKTMKIYFSKSVKN